MISLKPIGVNLGSGKWRAFRWVGIDSLHLPGSLHLDVSSKLSFPDSSIRYVFSSHFFEHVNDCVANALLKEAYRILQPGGGIRISVPDFNRTLERYFAGDDAFFDQVWGLEVRYENWRQHGIPICLESKLLCCFANFDNMSDRGVFPAWRTNPAYYCGPPKASVQEIREATQEGALAFSKWAVARLPLKDNVHTFGHVNCYTKDKLSEMLLMAGFEAIEQSEYRKSRFPALRGRKFDNRPELSLFVEAQKPFDCLN